ncbi:MAG: hypothetical protein U0P81_00370 [Holophagaceae bacterium]
MRGSLAVGALLLLVACGGGGSAPTAAPFSLALAPGSLRLPPAGKAAATVVVQGAPGFAGTVDLEGQGLGSDLSGDLQPARVQVAPGASVQALLTLRASDTALPAQRVLTLRASAGGGSATADLRLDIPAAKVFPVTTFVNQDQTNLTFLAYQDGDGPWTAVEGQGGVYKLPVTDPAGRFGLVYGSVCSIGAFSSWDVNGFFETVFDTQALYVAFLCNPQPGPPPVTFPLGGQLLNTAGLGGLISTNSGLWSFDPGAPRYDLRLIRGTGDLVAATYPDLSTYLPSRFIVERERDAEAPATRDLDFGAEGIPAPPSLPITAPAPGAGESLQGTVQYQTRGGQTVILANGGALSAYVPFPPQAALAGETTLYGFQASGPGSTRTVVGSFPGAPGPLAPALPSPIPPFTVPAAGGARLRLGLAWAPIQPTPETHQATFTQRAGLEEAYWFVSFSRRWLGEKGAFTWMPPDLGAVPGFDPRFLFRSGEVVSVSLGQSGQQVPASLLERLEQGFELGRGGAGLSGRARPAGRPGAFSLRRIPAAQAAAAGPESFYATRNQSLTP